MSTAEIAKALAAFQAEMPTVTKSQKAEVPTKSGGKYTYTYASLADVSEAALPLLTKHGLSFTACPRLTEHGAELVGTLLHTSGEALEGVLPINGRSPQEIGSAITYARRYLFGCMTGVVTDDDDDGQLAQGSDRHRQKPRPSAPPRQDQAPPPPPDRPITDKTRKALFALFTEVGIGREDDQRQFLTDTLGRPVESRASLTEDEGVRAGRRLRAIQQGDPLAEWAPTFQGDEDQ